MNFIGVLLVIISLSKLCIAGSSEKQELSKELFYSIKDDILEFEKKMVTILVIDGVIGVIGGLILLGL